MHSKEKASSGKVCLLIRLFFGMRTRVVSSHLLVVLDEDFYNNVLELDVHDGCDRLFLWVEQSRTKDHAQISDGHQVVLVVTRHATKDSKRMVSRLVIYINVSLPVHYELCICEFLQNKMIKAELV